jgi:hypothetical protein
MRYNAPTGPSPSTCRTGGLERQPARKRTNRQAGCALLPGVRALDRRWLAPPSVLAAEGAAAVADDGLQESARQERPRVVSGTGCIGLIWARRFGPFACLRRSVTASGIKNTSGSVTSITTPSDVNTCAGPRPCRAQFEPEHDDRRPNDPCRAE